MDQILFINSCIRPESRTLRLARHLLSKLPGQIQEVDLEREKIQPLNTQTLRLRQELLAGEDFSHPMLRYARQFRDADVIVIAAPYYDLSFPAALKNYLEAVACVGLTFYYDENEVAQTKCRARKLYYVSTGGGEVNKKYGFGYVKALVGEFYHIEDVQGFFAEKLDLIGSDPEKIMLKALAQVDAYFSSTVYRKLVRDKIPQLITKQGEIPQVRILENGEYTRCLKDKLEEETEEFVREENLEELADILEVCFALAGDLGHSREDLLKACAEKRSIRGGFDGKVFLISKV